MNGIPFVHASGTGTGLWNSTEYTFSDFIKDITMCFSYNQIVFFVCCSDTMFTLKVKDHPMYYLVPTDKKLAVADQSVLDELIEIPFKCCFPLCNQTVPSTASGHFSINGWCGNHES
jgi:hypothetical protein